MPMVPHDNAFDTNPMKDFTYSPSLTPDKFISSCNMSNGKQMQINLNEALIPFEQLVSMLNEQDKAGISPTLSINSKTCRDKTIKPGSSNQGGTREKKGLTGRARYRKRMLTPPPKSRSDPTKKVKHEEARMHAAAEDGKLDKAEARSNQPRHST